MPRPRLFSEFDEVSRETLKVLDRLGFERATAVQEAVIPLFSGHKDVAVDACTGSGKTLAFVIPVTEKLRRLPEKLKKYEVGCILIAPTRELSKQIFGVAKPFLSAVPDIQARLLVGGSDPVRDISEIKEKGANVLIGTPGRIDDILKRSKDLSVQKLEVLVLDEADRLLDMGFRTQLDSIMAQLPRQRRTGLFSATQTEAVEELVRAGLRNPFRVNVAVTATAPSKGAHPSPPADGDGADARSLLDQKTPLSLRIGCQVFERVEQKLQALVAFLVEHANEKVIVYFLTCACVNYYAALLPKLDELKSVQLLAVHGKLKQAARERNLSSFSASPTGVLLCTDLAARGLDIPDVQWILQFDPPQDPSAFVHRVGRTARMGRSGDAMAFLLLHESSYVDFLRIRKVPLSEMEAGAEDAKAVDSLVSRLRRYSETDRDLMERGVRAFVSYVRGYKEHHCRFIFRLQDLELGHLANAFGLLRLPKMKEIRRVKAWDGFTPSEKDPGTVKYSDKAREKQRQKLMAEQHAAGKKPPETKQVPPVLSGGKKASAAMEITTKSGKKLPASKRRLKQDRQDLQDLMEEYSLLKKLKKGKINEEEFDRATQWEEVPESSRPADDAGRSPRSSFSVPAGGNGDEDGGVGTGVKARSRATGDPGMKRNVGLASARKKEKHRKKRKKAPQPGG